MDLERNTRQLRLESSVTLADIEKFLERQSGNTPPQPGKKQAVQYVRFQPAGKTGKEPILSVDARKGTSKELQSFLAEIESRNACWGGTRENVFGDEAAALQDLIASCKKPRFATVDRINGAVRMLARVERRNFQQTNRYARTWEKHKAEICPGLGLKNVAEAEGKAGKTKKVDARRQAEQIGALYRAVGKVLSRLPEHFELITDRTKIENAIMTAVKVASVEEKAILVQARYYYLPDLTNEKVAVVVRDILPLLRMNASDIWDKDEGEPDAAIVRAACLKNLENRAIKLYIDRTGIDPRSTIVNSPSSPRQPTSSTSQTPIRLRLDELNKVENRVLRTPPQVGHSRSEDTSESSSIVGTPVPTPIPTPTTTPRAASNISQVGNTSGISREQPPSTGTPASARVLKRKGTQTTPPVSPRKIPETRLVPGSDQPPGGRRRAVSQSTQLPHSTEPTVPGLNFFGRNKENQGGRGPNIKPSRSQPDVRVVATPEKNDPDLDKSKAVMSAALDLRPEGANRKSGREQVRQLWNASRQPMRSLLETHYGGLKTKEALERGKRSIDPFFILIDGVLAQLPDEFDGIELNSRMKKAVCDTKVWMEKDKKIVRINTKALLGFIDKNSSDELQSALGIAASVSFCLPPTEEHRRRASMSVLTQKRQ